MRQYYFAAAILASAVLAGCGGGGAGNQGSKVQYTSAVFFGDSLSDVGSYKVGAVAAAGGGQFTINAPTSKNWTELMAAQLGLAAPCPAQTGIDDGTGVASPTNVPVVNNSTCTNYAQGGARVTDPIGIKNKSATPAGFALTVPLVTQISNHLSAHGNFTGNEVVFVFAGANDVFYNGGLYLALQQAPYNLTASQAMTAATIGLAGVNAATTGQGGVKKAATDLANLVRTLVTSGAKRVVVLNVPDIADTPYAVSSGAQTLFDTLVSTFNIELSTQLSGNANVLFVDAYSANRDEVVNPAAYGLTNVSSTACDIAGALAASGGSSLFCSSNTLVAGVAADTHYLFADAVHPTPYGYLQLARLVSKEMLIKGWM